MLRLVLIATTFVMLTPNSAAAQQVEFADALPSILLILLSDEAPQTDPPDLENVSGTTSLFQNTPVTNLIFTNNGGGTIESCSVTPPLPAGLSVRVTSNARSCQIVGTPVNESAANVYRVTATNAIDSASADITIEVLSSIVEMSGLVTYDLVPTRSSGNGLNYNAISEEAAAMVTVELLDINDVVIQTTRTDELGQYGFTLPDEQTVRIRVRAELFKNTGVGRYDVRVVDNTSNGALYTLAEMSHRSARANPVRNLHAASGWDGAAYTNVRAAAPFAMLDSVLKSINTVLAVDEDAEMSPLQINWSVNNRPSSGNPNTGNIGTSFYSNGNLFILGAANVDTDEYDDHVIIHEWGHYFEDRLSRSDSIGGSHSGGQRLDMRVAFGEGFGNAIAGMVTDDPIYVDTFGTSQQFGFSIDVEANPGDTRRGWYNESSVQSILYDFYDDDVDGSDNLALGFAPIYDILVNQQRDTPYFTSIFSFTKALRDANPASASAIDSIVSSQNIVAATIEADGTGETNDAGGGANVLPVHQTLTLGNTASTCVTTTLQSGGTRNKLSNHRFFSIDIPTDGSYDYSITRTSADYGMAAGNADTDPDLIVFRNGAFVHSAVSGVANSETGSVFLTAGLYALEFSDFEMTSLGETGTACFDVLLEAAP